MISLDLTWYQRISLWMRIGAVQAPNMQIAYVLHNVIEKIRPSDREREESRLTATQGGYTWLLPDLNLEYGGLTVEIESEEAEQLALVLENPPQGMTVLVADMVWIVPMIRRLKAASPAKKEEGELVAA